MAERPSLEDLLKDVPPEKLDQPCRDADLCEIALSLTEWQSIAPFLGLTEAEIEEIERDHAKTRTQKIAVLRKWRAKLGSKAKYKKLVKVFWKLERVDVAEEVCELLKTESSSSSSDEDGPPAAKRSHRGLDSYAEYLRGRYSTEEPTFFTLQWPPLHDTRKVFNLAMIHQQTIQRGPVDEDLVRQTQRGNVDDIMDGKVGVNLESMFSLDKKGRKVILIEGAPGAGKSTLAWQVCQRWESGQLFQEFKVAVFVQLRDPAIQSAKSLADILPGTSSKMRRELQFNMKACDGRGVLFVLDGWDEYGPGLHGSSLFQQLICRPGNMNMHFSSLVITSRPVASGELQQYASSRIEIVGFTTAEVKSYFTEALGGDCQTVQKLEEQLSERPVIQASCYLPLNAAIVVHLFIDLKQSLPHTLHKVFTSLILCCIIRHLKKQLGKEVDISSLHSLPPDIQEPFSKICALAFRAVKENKVTFSEEDLQLLDLPSQLSTLSLIQGVPCFRLHKKSTSYHFMHLSIQELLAAFHISKMEEEEQVKIFKSSFENPRFEAVFRFYAGFTKLETPGIRDVVAWFATRVRMSLLHCLYEAQDAKLCTFVASQWSRMLDLGKVTVRPLDYLVIGYFLSCVRCNTSEEFIVDLHLCEFDDYKKSLLVRELSKCIEKEGHAEVPGHLKIISNTSPYIGEVVNCSPGVKNLLLRHGFRNDQEGLGQILTDLSRNTSIVELTFDCVISQENYQLLSQMLRGNKTLKVLNMSNYPGTPDRRISDCCMSFIAEGLAHNTSLESLKLFDCGISPKGMEHLAGALFRNNCLKNVNLYSNMFGDDGIVHISKSLEVNCCLKKLDVSGIGCVIHEQGARALSKALELNTSLESLTVALSGRAEVSCVFEALSKNHTLQSLSTTIFFGALNDNCIVKLADALTLNSSLNKLCLFDCSLDFDVKFTDSNLMVLGNGLKRNKGLKTLYIKSAMESLQGLQQFLLCMTENDHLTELYIGRGATNILEKELGWVNETRELKKLPLLQIL